MMPENNGEICQGVRNGGSGVNGTEAATPIAPVAPAPACGSLKCASSQKNGISAPKAKSFKAGFKINQLADMLAKRSLKLAEGSDVESNGLSTSGSSEVQPTAEAGESPSSPEASALKDESYPPPMTLAEPAVPVPCVALDDSLPPDLGSVLDPPPPLTPVTAPDQPTTTCTAESVKTESPTEELTMTSDGPSECDSPPPPALSPASEQLPPLLEPQELPLVPTALIHSENSTKPLNFRTRSSPRTKKDSVETEIPPRKSKGRKTTRRSKKLVETSTQTADVAFASEAVVEVTPPPVLPCFDVALEPPVLKPAVPVTPPTYICLFCQLTFVEKTDCLNHEATHTLKRKTKFIKCQFCMKKLPNLEDFKSHCVKHHSSNFYLCSECDLRFYNNDSLEHHTKSFHYNPVERTHFNIFNKKVKTSGSNLDIDVNCEVPKRPSVSPRCGQKISPKEKTEDQLYEAEMLFYSHLSGNIQDNLSNHMDGKIDRSEMASEAVDSAKSSGGLLAVAASTSASSGAPPIRAPSPYRTRSKTPNPLPTSAKKFKKLPNWQQKFWEKYNFPSNYRYEHRFGDKNYVGLEKSPLYLKDLSCLDIKTQLTMRENVKKLDVVDKEKNSLSDSFPYMVGLMPVPAAPAPAEISVPVVEVIRLPKKKARDAKASRRARFVGENNVPQVVTRAQRLDATKQRKGSVDSGVEGKKTLRRQTSAELADAKVPADEPEAGPSKTAEDAEEPFVDQSVVSGEWVRPRSYLCGACCAKFSSLWDLEDHKWAVHPNVWCTHYEFEVDKLERIFHLEAEQEKVAKITLPDLYRRYLSPKGSLNAEDNKPGTGFPQQCTKCRKSCQNQPELHRHILDCGGDTTWSQTMCSSPATMKRRWRPYGSRRRKTTAQRGVKRTITSTPPLRNYITQPKIRTKPGDVESIQKMLANLPEKRTRRAINFDEVNTRSQTTIQNNRLLRKREAHLQEKVLPGVRNRTKTGGAIVRTDSPRRKFKLKEVTVNVTPLSTVPRTVDVVPASQSEEVNANESEAIKKTKKLPPVESENIQQASFEKRSKKKKNLKVTMELNPASDSVQPKTTPRTTDQQHLKKRLVQRKGYLIKTIKKRLTTSKKIMEKRRRSDRIKNIPKDEDGEFTTEEQLPIAKLKEVSEKNADSVPLVPQRILKGSAVAVPSETKPIEPPTDLVQVPEPIVIKVMRPKRKRKRKKVTLKVVKKLPVKAEDTMSEGPVEVAKSEEVVDEVLDVSLVPKVEVPVPEAEVPAVLLEPHGEVPVAANKVIKVKRVAGKRTKRRTRWSKKRPVKRLNPDPVKPAELIEVTESTQKVEEVVPEIFSKEETRQDTEQVTNFSIEKIMTDKVNENLVKRKGSRKHEKPKTDVKRLRMTVTLKEATLKVLDKPSVTPGPNKWTAVSPPDGIIKFDPPTPLVVPITASCSLSDGFAPEKEVDSAISVTSRKSRRVSKTKEPEPEPELLENVVEITCDSAMSVVDSSMEVMAEVQAVNNSDQENIIAAVADLKDDDSKINIDRMVLDVSVGPAEACKSSSDVSTTVPSLEETVREMDPPVVSSMKADSCSPSSSVTVSPVKSMMPIFTIEEATSSEDVRKPTSSKPSAPKIAEADSTGEKIDNISCSDHSTYEGKSEPEMVVSSTNPVRAPRKRKKRASVVDFDCKDEVPSSTLFIPEELDRRSRRKSKEVPSTNEFIIDDPLLLVDELWSDLDSDSDSKKKKVRRVKKKTPRKKVPAKREVDLEALLRNFGEKKDAPEPILTIKHIPRKVDELSSRLKAERKVLVPRNEYKRVSLRLFSFNKKPLRYGRYGESLLVVKETLQQPMLPLLPSVVTENPEQVIVCRSKRVRKKKTDLVPNEPEPILYDLKVSLPLELIDDLSLLNNNHLQNTEPMPVPEEPIALTLPVPVEPKPTEIKPKRSDCIDKIFSCEICKTYYYSSCQLRNHKQSNRHKQNESESLGEKPVLEASLSEPAPPIEEGIEVETPETSRKEPSPLPTKEVEPERPLAELVPLYEDKNDDSSEMPILEGPFLENRPVESVSAPPVVEQHAPPAPASSSVFGFSEESLKDIQKAIGCTDEEMLILTLLGENTAPEPDILDLSNCTPKSQQSPKVDEEDTADPNGPLKIDLKQRMTSALASLVNRAVQNLFNKTETVSKMAEKSDAMTFLNKLAMFSSRRKTTTVVDSFPSTSSSSKETKQLQLVERDEERYQFKCNICGNRFEKASTRDFHIARSHHKRKPRQDEELVDDWLQWDEPEENDTLPSSQFWCSDCGINFQSPQEVLEHQKAEHPGTSADGKKGAKPVTLRRCSDLDPEETRILANQALQKLAGRRTDRKTWNRKLLSHNSSKKTIATVRDAHKTAQDPEKPVDVYDFNEFDSDPEPVALTHVKKVTKLRSTRVSVDEDSEDNIPLAAVKMPGVDASEEESPTLPEEPDTKDEVEKSDTFKISLENKLLGLSEVKGSPSSSEEDSLPLMMMSKKDSSVKSPESSDHDIGENVIYQHNDSVSSFESADEDMAGGVSDSGKSSDELEMQRKPKRVVPSLTATLTDASNNKKMASPRDPVVSRVWNNPESYDEEGESDIDKEMIMKKVWKKKKEIEKSDDERSLCESIKIKQTEVSDEVVIKCGPKENTRRKSCNEPAKNAIVRRIWSGKCGFQTKAALKTYDSDLVTEPMPLTESSPSNTTSPPPAPSPPKRRARAASSATAKKRKVSNVSEDDLDSLLDEIEQENVEKAIRLEFLHLRRSEKSHVEPPKEPPGLFAENPNDVKQEKKRKAVKNSRLVKRRVEGNELSRRHKKHRHRHHHHKHKHKKSRHHRSTVARHRSKHRSEPVRVLERMCEDIASRSGSCAEPSHPGPHTFVQPRISTDLDNLDSKLDEILSPLSAGHHVNNE